MDLVEAGELLSELAVGFGMSDNARHSSTLMARNEWPQEESMLELQTELNGMISEANFDDQDSEDLASGIAFFIANALQTEYMVT